MQMIDVLKRLAELDAANPNVQTTMLAQEQSLGTITNIEVTEQINECGMMPSSAPKTPASIHMTADSGPELTGMLKDLMSLAGVKPVADLPAFGGEKSVMSTMPQSAQIDKGGDIHRALSVIDSMNDTPDSVDGLDRDGDGDHDMKDHELEKGKTEGQEDRVYDNSPEEEIEAHKYGDDQVSPKPQGLKQRQGDNPYKPVGEDIEQVSQRLMREYEEFVKQGK